MHLMFVCHDTISSMMEIDIIVDYICKNNKEMRRES